MPRKRPPYVQVERTRHGKAVYYLRIGKGPRTALPALNSPDFPNAYRAALIEAQIDQPIRRTTPSGSLQWLVDRYMESAPWASLHSATRRQRGLIFAEAVERSGNAPFAAITGQHMQRSVDDRRDTPAQANNFLKAMRGLFAWALRNELVQLDPTVGATRIKYKTVGFKPWTVEDVSAFRAEWPLGTTQRLCMELCLLTGLRRGDMHVVGKQHIRNGVCTVTTAKTGTQVTIPLPAEILALIEQTTTGDLALLVSQTGRPFASKEALGNWFGKAARQAGIKKNLHGLRKLSATLSAEGGGSAYQLMAHYGWVNIKEAETYTKGADRKLLGAASSAIVSAQIGNIVPLPENPHTRTGNKTTKKQSIARDKT